MASLSQLDPAQLKSLLTSLTTEEKAALLYRWESWRRPQQAPPAGDWTGWLIDAGRGWGKTRTGAETVRHWVEQEGVKRIGIVSETAADNRNIIAEGESGILSICPPWNMPTYEPSKRRITWPNGATAMLYDAREPNQLRGPQHEKCFVAGTMIATPGGDVPIEEVRDGDWVITRSGPRQVEAVSCRPDAVGRVSFSNGADLVGTADHPIYSSAGWVNLSELRVGQQCAGLKRQMDTLPLTQVGGRFTSIGMCGSTPTGERSRQGITSITRTTTRRTTILATLNLWTQRAIESCTKAASILTRLAVHPAARLLPASTGSPRRSASPARQGRQRTEERQFGTAPAATRSSAAERGIFAVSVVSTWAPAGTATVYNLQVSVDEEYFANGILVHNCWFDELAKYRYAEQVFDMAMFGLRLGKKPQWVATTTPLPTPFFKALLKRPDVVITKGKTVENLANLSPTFRKTVVERYKGTRLGRQELDAELIDDVIGALWSRRTIEECRVSTIPTLKRVVVGVDPATTSRKTSNEHGIITVGLGSDNHGYVLDDVSDIMTPDQMARRAVGCYSRHKADAIVVETNNGGDFIPALIKTINPNVNVIDVRAARGKVVRAEPISALYDQGRVHHVGTFPALEDQMTQFTREVAASRDAETTSPDRVDALVWALTDLFPDVVDVMQSALSYSGGSSANKHWMGS